MSVFQCLRLHGITSSKHLEDLRHINFFPQTWLTRILSNHYHALENGGDMAFQRDFSTQAVRFGLLIKERVKYTDPILSFFTSERSPVSMRQEREVKYEIKAQALIDGKWQEFSTYQLTQKFGITKPSCRSQVLKARITTVPIYVTFAILFPVS
ncbi:BTB/POZ domain-containing protein 16 isoform X2 [Ornithorhynchus anatinus]|uniref:BTB/POZ domain-containing protein 16 isoform X2 n=1 Tax=Ornithorhynchus anatinus TaxID=9258 RepID=UPI0010A8F366|nr:BTB/POZ domain-containing protein 16 isoform X2 [Ornithorhynchus anatinus]